MDIIKWNVRFAVELQFLLHQQMFHRDTILSVINLAPKMIHPEYIQPSKYFLVIRTYITNLILVK